MSHDERELFQSDLLDFLDFLDEMEAEDHGKFPIGLLLNAYSSVTESPFYYCEESFPRLSNHDLGAWLCWSDYYDRPRSEYPLARKLYPDMPEFADINLPDDAIV